MLTFIYILLCFYGAHYHHTPQSFHWTCGYDFAYIGLSTGLQVSQFILLRFALIMGFRINRDAINLADFGEYPARLAAFAPFAAVKMCSQQNLSHRICLKKNLSGPWQKTA